jgi:predicted dehydrogenase
VRQQALRAGVIGCGIGAHHAYAYARAAEYELVAVCDLNPDRFGPFFEIAGVGRGTVREYTDYRAMLDRERLDVVSVATPDELHTTPICDASAAGVKGIFCEKPLATTLEDADRIIEVIERNGTRMSVDHTLSWRPEFQAARSAVRSGEIGGLTRILAHMGGGRAMLFRNGTHMIDAVCYFAEADPVWVIAAHDGGFEDYGTQYKGQGGRDPALDPGTTLIVEFANGVRGIVNASKLTPTIRAIDLQGPGGRYLLTSTGIQRPIAGTAWKTDVPEGEPRETPVPWTGVSTGHFGESLVPAVQELARMIWHDAPSSSPPRRARDTLRIILGALRSHSRDSARVPLQSSAA